MPGLLSRAIARRNELNSFNKIQKLVQKDRRRAQIAETRQQPLLSNEIADAAMRESLLNDMVTAHLAAAEIREAQGKKLTLVQKRAKQWLQHNQWVALQRAPRTAWPEGRVEEEEHETQYAPLYHQATIPAPPYKSRKTLLRKLKSGVSNLLRTKTQRRPSPPPGYTPGLPPDYDVGGSKRRKTRKLRKRKTRKLRRH